MKHDVVIIGGGLGALLCARLLTAAGRGVVVLERQRQAGGCMQSFTRHGRHYDTGLHYVGGLTEGQRLHTIFSHLGLMRLPWQRMDMDAFDRITIGSQQFAFAQGYERFADTLASQFPNEREALHKYVDMLRTLDALPLAHPEVQKYMEINAYDYLTTLFHDPLLVSVLAGSALKMELRRESLPLFTFAHGNSSFIGGSWRLQGPGNMLVDTLIEDIIRAGGQVVCGSEVTSLVEQDGRITAARCANGEVYEADTFISNVHPTHTFALIEESKVLSRIFRRRMSVVENTHGIVTTTVVLRPDTVPYFNYNHYVYATDNVWTAIDPATPVDRVMVSCQAPSSASGYIDHLDLLTPVPFSMFEKWSDTRVGRRPSKYEKLKHDIATESIALAQRVMPSLPDQVAQCYVTTPLTWRDYNHTPEGSAYGMRKDSRNALLTMLSPRTPISNLLLTGQSLLLHGVEGVTMTALLTCQYLLGEEHIQSLMKE